MRTTPTAIAQLEVAAEALANGIVEFDKKSPSMLLDKISTRKLVQALLIEAIRQSGAEGALGNPWIGLALSREHIIIDPAEWEELRKDPLVEGALLAAKSLEGKGPLLGFDQSIDMDYYEWLVSHHGVFGAPPRSRLVKGLAERISNYQFDLFGDE